MANCVIGNVFLSGQSFLHDKRLTLYGPAESFYEAHESNCYDLAGIALL